MVRFSERANSINPSGVRRMFDMADDDAVQFGWESQISNLLKLPSKPSPKQ